MVDNNPHFQIYIFEMILDKILLDNFTILQEKRKATALYGHMIEWLLILNISNTIPVVALNFAVIQRWYLRIISCNLYGNQHISVLLCLLLVAINDNRHFKTLVVIFRITIQYKNNDYNHDRWPLIHTHKWWKWMKEVGKRW